MLVTSAITGFTFPGMMDEPGCIGGRLISPRPVLGPEERSLRSLAIRIRLTAVPFKAELSATKGSIFCMRSMRFLLLESSCSVSLASPSTIRSMKASSAFRPVPTAVPPIPSSRSPGSERSMPARLLSIAVA